MMVRQIRANAGRRTALKTVLVVVFGACVFAASAFAGSPASSVKCTNPYALNPTPAETAACSQAFSSANEVKMPAVPTNNSKTLAKAAFTGDYNTVWNFVSPQYQAVVSHSHWLTCQKRNPVAPPGVTVNRIAIATSGNVPMNLPQFGSQRVFEVQMQVLFTRGGAQSAALVYAYWFHNNQNKWVAVWLPNVYQEYKSGSCDPLGPSRGLY
jgi:hypothetical protein